MATRMSVSDSRRRVERSSEVEEQILKDPGFYVPYVSGSRSGETAICFSDGGRYQASHGMHVMSCQLYFPPFSICSTIFVLCPFLPHFIPRSSNKNKMTRTRNRSGDGKNVTRPERYILWVVISVVDVVASMVTRDM